MFSVYAQAPEHEATKEPAPVTEDESLAMWDAIDWDDGTQFCAEDLRDAGNALLALRAAQQKGGGQ